MNKEEKRIEITPAARAALDELTQDYRERLLNLAINVSKTRMSTPIVVALQDVNEAAQFEVSALEHYRKLVKTMRRVFLWVVVLSLIAAGLFFTSRFVPNDLTLAFVFKAFNRPLDEVLVWTGAMLGSLTIVGILVALVWQASTQRNVERTQRQSNLNLLATWSDFERRARKYIARHYGESEEKTLPRDIVSLPLFTEDEKDQLLYALTVRNLVAHGTEDVRTDTYKKALSAIALATEKLESGASVDNSSGFRNNVEDILR